jgi:hypothetical protein
VLSYHTTFFVYVVNFLRLAWKPCRARSRLYRPFDRYERSLYHVGFWIRDLQKTRTERTESEPKNYNSVKLCSQDPILNYLGCGFAALCLLRLKSFGLRGRRYQIDELRRTTFVKGRVGDQ